ncbi:TRAP transporter substrate-binding protein DctP [Castellaniella sp. S9]|uniref:TRAP transporter substrate-binding protein DctP n=1 Tax=Castellaniella sp. S9 TaxID=2993652 RepID=UPI0022B5BC15|nr:TRAP transporter substrate-binding protein DctP [Castellaniella sp. S9]
MKIKQSFRLTGIAATLFLATGLYSGSAVSQEVNWRAVSHQLPGTARFDGTVKPFAECVSAASGGRMNIQVFGGGVLHPVSESLDAVRNGVVQMGMIWSGYWAGKNPVFALAGSRPGDPINSFSENFYRAEKLEPIVAAAYEKEGVKSLGAFDFGPAEILNSVVEVRSLEDFKGKKVRAGGIGASYYTALGASAVTLTGTEIYQALQLGTVDMAEYNDWLVNKEMGFHEVSKYVIEPVLHTGATDDKELIVNPDAWEKLPDDLRGVVYACRDQARYLSAINYDIGNQKAKNEWLAGGVQIIQLPEADVLEARKIGAKVMLEFAQKSPEAAEYLKTYAQVLTDLGYTELAETLTAK